MTIVTNRKILPTHNMINQTFIPSHNYSPLGSSILLPLQKLLLAYSPMAISYLDSTTALGVAQWQGGTGLNIQPFYTDTRPPLVTSCIKQSCATLTPLKDSRTAMPALCLWFKTRISTFWCFTASCHEHLRNILPQKSRRRRGYTLCDLNN